MLSRAHPRVSGWSRAWLQLAVGMVLCALALRPGLPVPVPGGPESDLIALFGEGVLCRPGTANTDHDQFPTQPPSPAQGQHGDSHAAWCCHWNATAGIIPLAATAAIRIVFPVPAERFSVAAIGPPERPAGPAQPRAPPKRS